MKMPMKCTVVFVRVRKIKYSDATFYSVKFCFLKIRQ